MNSSTVVGEIIFGCLVMGMCLGMFLARRLPEHHLDKDSREMVKLGTGLIGTLGALVLGLLVSTAKNSYDTQKGEVTQMAARVILLDRTLGHYGPETRPLRDMLRRSVADAIDRIWPENNPQKAQLPPSTRNEQLFDALHALSPKTEAQRALQAQASKDLIDLGQVRWLLYDQRGSAISIPFLGMVTFWLTVIFVSFGLQAPRNTTVIATLLLCALSVSGAILLVLELDRPFDGIIQISSTPLQDALEQLGG